MRLAYIVSMKRGLPAFVYREIVALRALGSEPVLFTTKQGQGIYMPPADMPHYALLKPLRLIWGQLSCLAKNPLLYMSLLWEALRAGSLVHFIAAATFAPIMAREQVEMIYCQEALHSMFIGYLAQRLLGGQRVLDVPLVVMIHTDGLYIGRQWRIFDRALAACQQVLTVSEYNRNVLRDQFDIAPERVQVVRLGVDVSAFCPDERLSILIVAQFAKRKGHDLLLRAVKQLGRDDLVVWVVGEGTWGVGDYVDVRALVAELGMEKQVVFWGSCTEAPLRELYHHCDIFCLPSRTFIIAEGVPVSLMEAMASARPVISTRHAGIPELVQDILVAEEDVDELAEAIAYLADHPEVRQQMGDRNRQIVMERFDSGNVRRLHELLSIVATEGRA